MPLDVTVQILTHADDARIAENEYGVLIAVPSACTESGTAYVAFIEKGSPPPSVSKIEHAAYALAHFNGELDRRADYRAAILRAGYAA